MGAVQYRITKRALDGDTARIISLARPRAEITEAVKGSVLEEVRQDQIGPDMFGRSDIPDRMPHFERLVLDGQGRAVVLALAQEGVQVLDFFDEEGRYLGTIRPPTELDALRPPVIRGDTIWAVTTDDIGAEYVTSCTSTGIRADPAQRRTEPYWIASCPRRAAGRALTMTLAAEWRDLGSALHARRGRRWL